MTQSQKKYFNANDARTLIQVYGFALFPIHGVVDGKCTCGNNNCTNIGKHPATINGLKDATKDIDKLIQLWDKRKGLNVGIATGAISGIFVIDIDGEEGEDDIKKLNSEIPETLQAKTGRGRHLFFKHPGDRSIRTRRGVIGNKVDVRGDGGYVAGAGSNHIRGTSYEWVNPLVDIAEAPEWLLEIVYKDTVPNNQIVSQLSAPIPRLFASNSWSESDCLDLLSYINPDIGYDEWIKVGMALQSEGFGFSLWDTWSAGGSKYQAQSMASHWKSFKANSGVSFGTLVKMAQDGGWGNVGIRNHFREPTKMVQATPIEETKLQNNSLKDTIQPENNNLKDIKSPKIEFIPIDAIQHTTETNDFVHGLLAHNQLSVVYGESNCGKTFFMTDLCFHIATGKAWRGRRVDKGGVIYVALEGSYGLRNRVAAYRVTHGLEDAKFVMVTSQIDFLNPQGNIGDFIECVHKASEFMGGACLIVIDTLSRAIAGGDENSNQDMGMLVHHADRIRFETGAHVCFIHHSGKNKALGARGHSSLRAAVDTEIEISRDEGAEYSTIKIAKQREMEALEDMYFGLERVVLAVNGFNEEISSCVVREVDKEDVSKPQQDRALTGIQQFVYDAIVNAIAVTTNKLSPREGTGVVPVISYEAMWIELEKRGYKEMVEPDKAKNATTNIRIALRRAGKIDFTKNWIWVTLND